MGLLAEGDVAEDLTKETKEKLKKMFTPSKPNEEITTLDQSTDRPEWTAAKAEAEPEAVQTRQNIPSERPMKENHKEEDKRTQRSQRRRKREPAGRNLRRSKAEVRGTWTTVAWEATKQCIRNMLYVWGIFCLLAMIPVLEAKAEDLGTAGYDCVRPMASRMTQAENKCLDVGTCWPLRLTDSLGRGDNSDGVHQEPGSAYDLGGLEAVAEDAVEGALLRLHAWNTFLWFLSCAGTLGGCISLCIIGVQLSCFVGRHAQRRICGDCLRRREIRRTVRRVDRRYSETEMETRTPRKKERDPEAETHREELLYGGGHRRT